MIDTLIDKQDNFEIIRDEIAAILKVESTNQMTLATDAGKDADEWKLRVFTERSNPWEQWINEQSERSPIVNVWYDNSNFDPKASNVMERQKAEAVFNIDCYGFAVSSDDAAGGHKPGDREAALKVQQALRLVRNILMAAEYTYLGLRGLVWSRWPQSVSMFQPQQGSDTVQQIVGARLAFRVVFNEFSPQITGDVLELVSASVLRAEDGEIVIAADYEYPL